MINSWYKDWNNCQAKYLLNNNNLIKKEELLLLIILIEYTNKNSLTWLK